jgi:uroporphyrinogen III methyltransferase / synthase
LRACEGRVDVAAGRPLEGKTAVVTRPREQAASLAEPLERLGANVLLVPVIRIVPRALGESSLAILAHLHAFTLIAFTSANAVRIFFGYLDEMGVASGPAAFAGISLAAIGSATEAALERRGVHADVVADDYVSEGLLRALERHGTVLTGSRVLIPQAGEARDVVPDVMRASGAHVDVLTVYDTLPAECLPVPHDRVERAHLITFASGSAVFHFVELLRAELLGAGIDRPLAERLAGARLCSIGPATSEALRRQGLPVAVEATEHSAAGLVASILASCAST